MLFVVIREQGPRWDCSVGMRDQPCWPEHVRYINDAAEDGFLLLAGPISDGDYIDSAVPVGDNRIYRAMLIVKAATEIQVNHRLDADPWSVSGALRTASIQRWEVLVGNLPATCAHQHDG